ncbi:hypothetical protein BDW62DRAFT_16532 [Aspergillus aurantiobrunneus]
MQPSGNCVFCTTIGLLNTGLSEISNQKAIEDWRRMRLSWLHPQMPLSPAVQFMVSTLLATPRIGSGMPPGGRNGVYVCCLDQHLAGFRSRGFGSVVAFLASLWSRYNYLCGCLRPKDLAKLWLDLVVRIQEECFQTDQIGYDAALMPALTALSLLQS